VKTERSAHEEDGLFVSDEGGDVNEAEKLDIGRAIARAPWPARRIECGPAAHHKLSTARAGHLAS